MHPKMPATGVEFAVFPLPLPLNPITPPLVSILPATPPVATHMTLVAEDDQATQEGSTQEGKNTMGDHLSMSGSESGGSPDQVDEREIIEGYFAQPTPRRWRRSTPLKRRSASLGRLAAEQSDENTEAGYAEDSSVCSYVTAVEDGDQCLNAKNVNAVDGSDEGECVDGAVTIPTDKGITEISSPGRVNHNDPTITVVQAESAPQTPPATATVECPPNVALPSELPVNAGRTGDSDTIEQPAAGTNPVVTRNDIMPSISTVPVIPTDVLGSSQPAPSQEQPQNALEPALAHQPTDIPRASSIGLVYVNKELPPIMRTLPEIVVPAPSTGEMGRPPPEKALPQLPTDLPTTVPTNVQATAARSPVPIPVRLASKMPIPGLVAFASQPPPSEPKLQARPSLFKKKDRSGIKTSQSTGIPQGPIPNEHGHDASADKQTRPDEESWSDISENAALPPHAIDQTARPVEVKTRASAEDLGQKHAVADAHEPVHHEDLPVGAGNLRSTTGSVRSLFKKRPKMLIEENVSTNDWQNQSVAGTDASSIPSEGAGLLVESVALQDQQKDGPEVAETTEDDDLTPLAYWVIKPSGIEAMPAAARPPLPGSANASTASRSLHAHIFAPHAQIVPEPEPPIVPSRNSLTLPLPASDIPIQPPPVAESTTMPASGRLHRQPSGRHRRQPSLKARSGLPSTVVISPRISSLFGNTKRQEISRRRFTYLGSADVMNPGTSASHHIDNGLGLTPEFANAIPPDPREFATCPLCVDVCERAVRLSCCANVACSSCIWRWLAHSKSCPFCRSRIGPGHVAPAQDVQDMVKNLVVRCKAAGCGWEGRREQLNDHLAEGVCASDRTSSESGLGHRRNPSVGRNPILGHRRKTSAGRGQGIPGHRRQPSSGLDDVQPGKGHGQPLTPSSDPATTSAVPPLRRSSSRRILIPLRSAHPRIIFKRMSNGGGIVRYDPTITFPSIGIPPRTTSAAVDPTMFPKPIPEKSVSSEDKPPSEILSSPYGDIPPTQDPPLPVRPIVHDPVSASRTLIRARIPTRTISVTHKSPLNTGTLVKRNSSMRGTSQHEALEFTGTSWDREPGEEDDGWHPIEMADSAGDEQAMHDDEWRDVDDDVCQLEAVPEDQGEGVSTDGQPGILESGNQLGQMKTTEEAGIVYSDE
ncbi:uncharacterized protein SPPG_08225 [Spizellomyces punctatus DAOM BR117]|uniref:RING-type domain-containing protein n=1 Tax=Spizellomyces punctatus (strain DAOM BR117) TaxID=645134 RepID=A0A0L0H5S5_SPIPD|nr:uncharacterized protein SPPG_08225 [Spizellomyces punctatus DAOM BR117]KNC96319.1 hypothetical protein SPPG_08225 [Spizellomyces punctatus DAOM BR117]|eukprot:XP_016604359.1 hypothetical protein SPPG_08225 [Spizellomyces punctatus DAOM BR117]